MTIALIAALDENGAIGVDNTLPWHLPDDLKRFKRLTLGHTMLMGRRTAESLGRALPGRRHLVLTRHGAVPFDGMEAVPDLTVALAMTAGDMMVIGGGEVFALTLPIADVLHLTHVHVALPRADAHFPPYDRSRWREIAREAHAADEKHAYAFDFVDYVRDGARRA
jgi:dihydrofolate reductase